MRILHTSDWHIGRTFHGHRLLSDQRVELAAIAEIVDHDDVDVVMIAGDLYDRAIPSADATQLATRAISDIRQAGAEVVAISGNHDSAPRLGAFSDILASGGFHLRTDPARLWQPILLGPRGDIAVYAIPYLEPDVVRELFGLPAPAGHRDVLQAAMDRIRADQGGRDLMASIVIAHAFVTGAKASESERSIAVGGVESAPASVFDGVDYVALGHLHSRQEVTPTMRYSGSILPYSFGEASQHKGVYLVDVSERGEMDITWRELPVARPLAQVRGLIDEVLAVNDHLSEHYLAVTVTDTVQPLDGMRRIREKFPYAATLTWEPAQQSTDEPRLPSVTRSVSDEDVVEQFLADCRSQASPSEHLLISEVVSSMRAAAGQR